MRERYSGSGSTSIFLDDSPVNKPEKTPESGKVGKQLGSGRGFFAVFLGPSGTFIGNKIVRMSKGPKIRDIFGHPEALLQKALKLHLFQAQEIRILGRKCVLASIFGR